ncbi:hypothetical protein L3X38_017567 [Prunus dulcis]|uniref:Uncharacterized protein n=1 Tax=Prunus dulcis TaxID=3755 RepID=A0AAD4W9Y7_PRUDU|nr:hypothetical protein L3X38_017567 [Prunus dulcis]
MSESSTDSTRSNRYCFCGMKIKWHTSWTNLNPERRFEACDQNWNSQTRHHFFDWLDNETCPSGKEVLPGLLRRLSGLLNVPPLIAALLNVPPLIAGSLNMELDWTVTEFEDGFELSCVGAADCDNGIFALPLAKPLTTVLANLFPHLLPTKEMFRPKFHTPSTGGPERQSNLMIKAVWTFC